MVDKNGQAGAITDLRRDLRKFLRWWEDSPLLPSEASEKLVDFVLRHDRLQEAVCEIDKIGGERKSLAVVLNELAASDTE
jgi:hypothetical protein